MSKGGSPSWDELYRGYVGGWVKQEASSNLKARQLLVSNSPAAKAVIHNVVKDNLLAEMRKRRGPDHVGKISSYGMVRNYERFVESAVRDARKAYGIASKGYVKGQKVVKDYTRSYPKRWSGDEVGFLESHQDWSMKRLSEHFGRTASSISTKLYRIRG